MEPEIVPVKETVEETDARLIEEEKVETVEPTEEGVE